MKNDCGYKSGSADRAMGKSRADTLHLVRLPVERSKDLGHRMLRRSNMPMASGSRNNEGEITVNSQKNEL